MAQVVALRAEITRLQAELSECQRDNVIYKACANGYAASALKALMDITGSYNQENPWLGITAAVVLLQVARAKEKTGDD